MINNIPIYVISLARASDRRKNITARLNVAGFNYEIIDAVDGRMLQPADYKNRFRPDLHRRRYGRYLYLYSIGCVLSHENLWERMVKQKTKVALILEDDATWDDDLFTIIDEVINCDWQWDMVILSHLGGSKKFQTLANLTNARKLIRRKRPGWSTAGYLIRLSGAKKLLQNCYIVASGADVLTREYWRTGLATYSVTPSPVSTTGEESVLTVTGVEPYKLNLYARRRASLMRQYRATRRKIYHYFNPPKRK